MNSLNDFANSLIKRLGLRNEASNAPAHWYPLNANLAAHPLRIPRSASTPDKPRALWQRLLNLGCMRHGDAFICCIAAAPFVNLPNAKSGD